MPQYRKKTADERGRASKKQVYYRLFALFLAILMLGSIFFYTIFQMILAADAAQTYTNPWIAVGLMYNDDVTVDFQTETANGFTVGATVITRDSRSFTPLWTLDLGKVTVACDANLNKVKTDYVLTSGSTAVVGGYHLELEAAPADRAEAEQLVSQVGGYLSGTGYYAIPCYINGAFRVRVGHFATEAGANSAKDSLTALKEAYNLSVAGPSQTAVTVLDPASDRILFEYDGAGSTKLGLEPYWSEEKAYTKTPAGRIYDGIFVYHRHISGSVDGVAVTNLVQLEDYTAGVITWEISPSWHHETQKVFAIAARTFVMRSRLSHGEFDVCNTQHCQAYLGCGRVNDNVLSAIAETRGQVLAYDGRLASVYYSSSTGGETVRADQAWVSNPGPYLVNQATPWEKYSIRGNGIWTAEASPKDLRDYLVNVGGYSALKGDTIASITIEETAGATGYVYTIAFRDNLGNTVRVTKTDTIRIRLAKYVKSANFVVGKGSVTRSYDQVNQLEVKPIGSEIPPTLFDKIKNQAGSVLDRFNNLFNPQGASAKAAAAPSMTQLTGEGDYQINIDKTTITETITASSSGNFVFAGRGYGHGVGMSQYGALDLAEAGATAAFILNKYFPGTQIVSYGEFE